MSLPTLSGSQLLEWRERFRQETPGQIVHDSLHGRAGWTKSYLVVAGSVPAGYGSIAVAGPWQSTRTVFEFYISPEHRAHAVTLFDGFLQASGATHFELQTSHALLHECARRRAGPQAVDKIVFRDEQTTARPAPTGAIFRAIRPADAGRMYLHHEEPVGSWVVELDGTIAATGGILSHYNPPYCDLFMEVAAPFRRRGLGSYLLQELKRVCRDAGGIPCARCRPDNLASRRTLQNSGFAPWAEIVTAPVK